MKPQYCIFFLILISSEILYAATSIEELAKKYADAYLEKDGKAISLLYHDAWDECRYPEYNEILRSGLIEKGFDSEIYSNYRIEIEKNEEFEESDSKNDDWDFYFGVKDVEYYPITPTHSLTFWLVSDEKASMAMRQVANRSGDWLFVHTCAGEGAEEYLETYNALEESLKNI